MPKQSHNFQQIASLRNARNDSYKTTLNEYNNEGYKASLEIGKLYCVIPDEQAASHGYIRVIDESGEDYGYSAKRFFPIKIPKELERTLFINGAYETLGLPPDKLMRRTREKSKQHATQRK